MNPNTITVTPASEPWQVDILRYALKMRLANAKALEECSQNFQLPEKTSFYQGEARAIQSLQALVEQLFPLTKVEFK
jgi:hypothetical protein